MQTPSPASKKTHFSSDKNSRAKATYSLVNEWRCSSCGKLLGVFRDGGMHLRFARSHEYVVTLPVIATCRGCGALNQSQTPPR